MRALIITKSGGPEVLEIQDRPDPEPARGEVLIKVAAAGVNRADLLQRMGRYPVPEGYPEDIPGLEYSGTIEAVGEGVDKSRIGERVMGITGGGAMAEKLVAHNRTAIPVPESVDLVEGAAIPEAFITAWDAAWLQGGLRWERQETDADKAGRSPNGLQSLLIHAAGSGVGTAAVQLAKAVGVQSIGTSRTPEKLEKCEVLGLDVAVDTSIRPGFSDKVLEHAPDGVDCVLDLVGGDYISESLKCLRRRGTHVCVGLVAGRETKIDFGRVLRNRLRIQGTVLRARAIGEKISLSENFAKQVTPRFEDGALKPVIDKVFDMDQAGEAHEYMQSNASFGKLILKW